MTTTINCAGYPVMTINGQTWIGTSAGNPPVAAIPTFGDGFIFSPFAGGWGLANNSNAGFIIVDMKTIPIPISLTIQNNHNYVEDTQGTFIAPSNPNLGDTYMFTDVGTNVIIQFTGSQVGFIGSLATSAGGAIHFTNQDGGLTMVCVHAGGSLSQYVCYNVWGSPYVS